MPWYPNYFNALIFLEKTLLIWCKLLLEYLSVSSLVLHFTRHRLSGNSFSSEGVIELFGLLNLKRSTIRSINLKSNDIGDKSMQEIGKFLKENKIIEKIDLSVTNITDKGIAILAPYLVGNTTLKSISFQHNKCITPTFIPVLAKVLSVTNIEKIDIDGTSITNELSIAYLNAIVEIKKGNERLILSDNKFIDDKDIIQICECMEIHGIDKIKYLE